MIPKKIHYCWFGGKPLPASVLKCIESWKKYCPDYEIIRWDESNYDVKKIDYTREAYEAGKFAFVSDYVRLDVVYRYGGIYLDTDVEVIKSFDTLLDNGCFLGMELPGKVNTGLGFGSQAGNQFILSNMRKYLSRRFIDRGKIDLTSCVEITTEILKQEGLSAENSFQELKNCVVYPTDSFCPCSMVTRKLNITNNTFSIHHYDASWYDGNLLKRQLKKRMLPLKVRIKEGTDSLFGVGTYAAVKRLLGTRK